MFNVLFLCTGNSKRSIMAEALLNHWGKGRFKAFSAGSHPKEKVDSNVIEIIKAAGIEVPSDITPKSWDVFGLGDSPKMDFVITVCDKAKGEQCPVWPGQPMSAHWGVEDPVEKDGDLREYKDVLRILTNRIQLFTLLKHQNLSRMKLQQEMDEIGLKQ